MALSLDVMPFVALIACEFFLKARSNRGLLLNSFLAFLERAAETHLPVLGLRIFPLPQVCI